MVERMIEYGGNVLIASQNRIGKVVEGHGTILVASRTESECFTVVCDGIFKILHATRLLIASKNRTSKVVEGHGTNWVARRMESE